MDIVNLGGGLRWRTWVEAARAHPAVRSIAAVSSDRDGAEALTGVRSYPTLESACHEVKQGVAILTAGAALESRQAVKALQQGMHVILDRPDTLDLAALVQLVNAARESKRAVILAREDTGGGASRLRSLLGKVGSISHVSYVERRSEADLDPVHAPYAQLIRYGLDHLERLHLLFDAAPVRVIARYTETPRSSIARGTTAEVLLELERNIHVQYFGSTHSSHHEQGLWVEGKGGSLRTDGASVWWRKRGWPRFVLWRWRPSTAPNATRSLMHAARHALNLLQQAVDAGPSGDAARRMALAPLALLGSIMRSSQEARIIEVSAWMNSDNKHTAAAVRT